ncbi:DUF4124 domain-containing protein [Ectopseudomonas oleovorans]|uniref:DUF4124 domain-containing protein n=1 Tax=Ectopseudomonas oleovorans TaxID=301 RepID=A0AA42TZB4_ECTOL|nr:DUF4124 domain-containing protein [Pseudomonas oleovorans]MDH1341851.1 DUF4124 domain-containing protein [Pseudomonas oleovorans]MDH1490919.1 DUF4124 domain-containing protein [Pseudomonas oleovorans]WGG19578.1 DUF4124 domain-containing protein [Pseudomonas oleovorans]
MKIYIFILAVMFASVANAQIFKCVGPDGAIAFSQVPCPPGGGESQYLGEVQRTVEPESSSSVVERNLRAAEIMRGNSAQSGGGAGTKVTVVKDSSRQLTTDEIIRERLERKRINAENGIQEPEPSRKRVVTNCLSNGDYTNCFGSDGSRSTTIRNGRTSTTIGQQ